MAFLQLKSTNKKLSYIITKSPQSGMQIKKLKQGLLFGYYTQKDKIIETEYNIFFKDSDNNVSFKEKNNDSNFEYLNLTRYNSPIFISNAIDEFLSSAIKKKSEYDISDIYEHEIIIDNVNIKKQSFILNFLRYFNEFNIEINEKGFKNFEIKILTKTSLYSLLNLTYILSFMIALLSDEYIDVEGNKIDKLIKMLNSIDSPFFVKYLFSRNILTNKKIFFQYKDELEKNNRYKNIDMKYGPTNLQRKIEIENFIDFQKPILDVGCGEGFYAIDFSKKLKDKNYYAVDIDEKPLNVLINKINKFKIENIKTYSNISKLDIDDEKIDIILTEVIEHMSKDEAKKLIKELLKFNYDKFIITTPNKDFNKHYLIDKNEFRHLDHDWEENKKGFLNLIEEILPDNTKYKYYGIGDEIDDINTSQMVVIEKQL